MFSEFFAAMIALLPYAAICPAGRKLRDPHAHFGTAPGRRFGPCMSVFQLRVSLTVHSAAARRYFAALKLRVVQVVVTSGDLHITPEFLGNTSHNRMVSAALSIYSNCRHDALYLASCFDADGNQPDGRMNPYRLCFRPGVLPPLYAFMLSILPMRRSDHDGAITLLMHHELPTKDEDSKRLPAPDSPHASTIRLYLSKAMLFHGQWKPLHLQIKPHHPKALQAQVSSPVRELVTPQSDICAETDRFFYKIARHLEILKCMFFILKPMLLDQLAVLRIILNTLNSASIGDTSQVTIVQNHLSINRRFMSVPPVDNDQYPSPIFYIFGTYPLLNHSKYRIAIAGVNPLQELVVPMATTDDSFPAQLWEHAFLKAATPRYEQVVKTYPSCKNMMNHHAKVDETSRHFVAATPRGPTPNQDATHKILNGASVLCGGYILPISIPSATSITTSSCTF